MLELKFDFRSDINYKHFQVKFDMKDVCTMGKLMISFVFVNCPWVKNKLFHYIHQRIRSYGKSHKSQKVGWYKRRWGYEITQFYFDKDKRKIKGDLDKIIKKLNDELTMVRNLSKKQFRKKFSHKTPKYKQRIQKEIWWERSDDNVKHYTSPPFRGVVKDLL